MAEQLPEPTPEELEKYLSRLKQGLLMEIEIKSGLFRGNYLTQIRKVLKNKEIALDIPVQDGKLVEIWRQTRVYLSYFLPNEPGAVYLFDDKIDRLEKSPQTVLYIPYPKIIYRLQRRNFVRVDCTIPFDYLEYKMDENGDAAELIPVVKRGFAMDLSGGGIFLRSFKRMVKGQLILLSFTLGQEQYRQKGRIMRVVPRVRGRKEFYMYGVLFEDIDPSVQRSIIGYVFELERQQIRQKKERAAMLGG